MKEHEQIIDEAAQQCAALFPASFGLRAFDFKPIIQAAIEKAYKQGYEQGLSAIEKVDEHWRERFRKFEKIEEKFGPAVQRAAHASEPLSPDERVSINEFAMTQGKYKCDGNHAAPICDDSECWLREDRRAAHASVPPGVPHSARELVAKGIAAHKSEQNDTKRLDWLLRHGNRNILHLDSRRAIDAAMRKET